MSLRWIFVIIFISVLFALGISPSLYESKVEPIKQKAIVAVERVDTTDYKVTKALISSIEINKRLLEDNSSTWMTEYLNDYLKDKNVEKIEDGKWLLTGSKDKGHIHILPGTSAESVTQFTLTIQRLLERKNNNNYLIQTNNILPTKNCFVIMFEENAIHIKADERIKLLIKYENPAHNMFRITDSKNGFRIQSRTSDRCLATFALSVLSQYDNDIFEN